MQNKNNFLIYLLVIIVIALLSGILGSLAIKIFLPNSAETPEVVVRRVRVGEGPAEFLLRETVRKSVYLVSRNTGKSLFTLEDIKARGVILTSDGWIITSSGALPGRIQDYQAITAEGHIFNIIQKVTDPASDIAFLQLGKDQTGNDANSLPVISLAREAGLATEYYVVPSKEELITSDIIDLAYLGSGQQIESADFLGRYYLLQKDLQTGLIGSPVVNNKGELVGIIEDNNLVIPAVYFFDLISEVLRSQKIIRNYLGVHYLDLSKVYGNSFGRNKGAFLTASLTEPAIKKNTPGWRGGLYAGDIVIKIEGEELNGYKNLSQIIQEYESGIELKFTVLRAGEEKELMVKLGVQ